jgi:hypothetical protein
MNDMELGEIAEHEERQTRECVAYIAELNGYPVECEREATAEDRFGNALCAEHAEVGLLDAICVEVLS